MNNQASTTLTKTSTKTKLAIATAVLIGAGGIALAAIPYLTPSTGTNLVNVYSCTNIPNGVQIVGAARQNPVLLTNGCKSTGYVGQDMRDYTMRCVPPSRGTRVSTQYQVTWKPCASGLGYGYGYGYNKR